jgi:hypothetical protein
MKTTLLFCALLLLGTAASAAVPNPTVTGPITGGSKGYPLWDSWFELGPFGYTEAEYFISGTARQIGSATTAAYTTRIIVTRPIDPADFNGTVLLDWVNVTAQFENAVDTIEAHDFLLREGYAFVHVSAQAVGICCTPLTPQVWDPVRYGAPESTDVLNHPGDDYSFDMFAQIAQALKSPLGIDPMGGLDVARIIAAGQSQSASRLNSYATQVQGAGKLGEFVIDAFLIHGGGSKTALPAISPSPVLHLLSDAEASPTEPGVSPNYALWEIAGAAHSGFWIGVHSEEGQGPRFAGAPKMPATAEHDIHVGNPPYTAASNYGEQVDPGQPLCILQGSQFPMHFAVNAAITAIDRWLRTGVKPPSGPRYQFNGADLARDQYNNALGGIRFAPIEHPVASYFSDTCVLGGTTVPFTEAQILQLYPTHADYACRMRATTYQNVKDRFLLEADAISLLERVDGAANRWTPAFAGVADCDADGVADAEDNCPHVANADQLDSGGVNTTEPDGIGDACQCGDVSNNGIVNGQDANAIRRRALGSGSIPTFASPFKCDVSGNGSCNGQDANAVKAAALGQPSPLFGQNCQAADPYAPVCTNCE